MFLLIDAHFHLDFLPKEQRGKFARDLAQQGVQVVAQTLLPSAFLEQYVETPRCAVGLHPWQVGELSPEALHKELELFEQALALTQFVGEVGLDFAPRRRETADEELQSAVLRRILQLVAQDGQARVVSLHAVRSVDRLLDITQGLPEHVVKVIHWFSGTSDELTRHIIQGGLISVNPRMLRSKRGRAYVQQVPADRLLLETDLPEEPLAVDDLDGLAMRVALDMHLVVEQLSELRGEEMRPVILENQRRVFSELR